MTSDEIQGTSKTLIVAGSETSATTLASAIFYLTTNPETLAKLNAEIRGSFRDEGEISFAAVQKLSYLAAVIDETLRMHPPVATGFPRQAQPGGTVICGYYMPEGVS